MMILLEYWRRSVHDRAIVLEEKCITVPIEILLSTISTSDVIEILYVCSIHIERRNAWIYEEILWECASTDRVL